MINFRDDHPAGSLERGDRVRIAVYDAPDVEASVIGLYTLPKQPVMVLVRLSSGETVDLPSAAVRPL